ncbi:MULTISPECIES: UDP-glucose/GDP-mannose dehydrogenase family protein [unclassified Legionella]|uniref:UDP-glucose dehydrogenase family protein n=1 Tax=unclassified Legionella TaxID=2622702 RepID=UPI0013EF7566|nr:MULTISPECIES: UDP-glucose/GDP-mannose dehydrogenase family protein [unclassified Legionella]MDI9817700.1 UDP-glucose/GDP-mannose dehydrogenase family protein [Legionella sp. PL877]
MIIAVYGAGYVGLVSAVGFAKLGHQVICADVDEEKIARLIAGECPIHEKQLPELLQEQRQSHRLEFTNNLAEAIKTATVHLIATGTPGLADGQADLSQVFAVVSRIAKEAEKDGILVTKSTVPVGTGDRIQAQMDKELAHYGKKITITVASNPEFLREGTAIYDFLNADRIIIGGEERALATLKLVYQPLVEKGIPLLTMSRRSAELAKYSANALLACKISFINQISQLAEQLGANIDEIRQGIALDHRIGPHFLYAGIGYGGSCFPKDVRALIQTSRSLNINTNLWEAIGEINEIQKNWVFKQLSSHFAHELQGLTIGIWGLSFKPDTDDLREASSLVAIKALLASGVQLRLFDPAAMSAAKKILPENAAICWCDSAKAVLDEQLDALVIMTEWSEFKNFCLNYLKDKLGNAPLIDGRNCFDLTQVAAAQLPWYYSVGRPLIQK